MRICLRRSAALGAAAWALVAVLAPFGWIEKLFLLAPLVAMPLAFALLEPAPWMTAVLQPPAAAAATASFFVEPGWTATGLAAPWAILTGVALLEALMRIRAYDRATVVLTLAHLLLPVGGFWLLATRSGFAPLGFPEPIVLLTAVHFHFTAFLAPLLAVQAGDRWAGPAVLLGTPLLAVGFVYAPALKLGATVLLAAALSLLAWRQLRVRTSSRVARALLAMSSLCVLAGMSIAAVYELGFFTRAAWLSIPQVARSHGPLNGLGFALGGLVAWTLERR